MEKPTGPISGAMGFSDSTVRGASRVAGLGENGGVENTGDIFFLSL
jgi:hypothetical protein